MFHKRGDKVQFRGYTATILFVWADTFQLCYVDEAKNIHIVHVRSI